MIEQTDNVFDLNAVLHPGTVFDHPRDVVADATLSLAEKRALQRSRPIPRCARSRAHDVS
jgi:hypothetical protein